MKSMKAAKAVAPPKRRPSTNVAKVMPAKTAVKVFKAMKAMKAAKADTPATPNRRPSSGDGKADRSDESDEAMEVPKAMKAMKAANAMKGMKVPKGMKAMKAAMSDSVAFKARDAPDNAGHAPTATPADVMLQVALQQSWHIDTRNVPEIWVDGPTGPRPAVPGDKILFKFFKPN